MPKLESGSSFVVSGYDPEKGIVFLMDCDVGKSMTNDAEAVCRWAEEHYPGCRVLYRDTIGRVDEMVHERGTFCGFKPYQTTKRRKT
jgi:hypothetical protein